MDQIRFSCDRHAGARLALLESQRQIELVGDQQLNAFACECLKARGRSFNNKTARGEV